MTGREACPNSDRPECLSDGDLTAMPTNVIMPQMGESIFEGTLTRWLKKPGDTVQRDEPLFEISTDKVDAEIPSPAAGVLSKVLVNEGQTVQINTVVAEIAEEGEATAPAEAQPAKPDAAKPEPAKAAPAKPEPAKPEPAKAAPAKAESAKPEAAKPQPAKAAPAKPEAAKAEPEPASDGADGAGGAEGEDARSSPLVRKMAAEHGVDLSQVTGTGLGGRISKNDMTAYLEGRGVSAPQPPGSPAPAARAAAPSSAAKPAAPSGRVEVMPLSGMRQKIAQHMVESKRTSAHVTTVFAVDLTRVVKLREQTKAEFEQRNGIKLTYMPFIARAAINALKAFPWLNASMDGANVLLKKDINLGIAVALDWGLIVPVIKSAEEKNLVGLARAIRDLADRARAKKLLPDEVQNGTFTITNPGSYGALFGTPIINQPQVAIMGMGAIYKAPVVVSDGDNDSIAIHSIIHLTLSFDHRLIDGALADQFMAHVKKTLENWEEPLQ